MQANIITPRRNEHMTAMTAAIMLHVGIAAWMLPKTLPPVALRQQVIQISMVAPSSIPSEPVKPKTEDMIMASAAPKQEAPHIQKKIEKKIQPKEKPVEREAAKAPSVATSGPQAADATAKVAASTEPVFDAAYLHNPPPAYPPPARRQGVQGKVMLEVDVLPQGNARDVAVAQSSGSPLLDAAALDAVRQWRFVPAKRGDEIVEAKVYVPVEFKLD